MVPRGPPTSKPRLADHVAPAWSTSSDALPRTARTAARLHRRGVLLEWPAMGALRIGVLGLHHDHVWGNLAALAAGSLGRLIAVAEPDAVLRERLARIDGGVAVHGAYDELF